MTVSTSVAISMGVPPDQNTAPVLEFRCLYTADTRRKQKRWQDGRLKYHTFNKRVMVFDERSNLVGDAHWREKAALDEGAELELERNGILVEVSEFLERKDQDLTELIDKRVKEREERFIARNGDSSPARSTASAIRSQSIAAAHSKPKPLNSILGTPSGHYGKAFIPNTSPFEQRQMLNASSADENESPRPTKRRKANETLPSKSGFAQNLMGATLSFTPTPSSTGPIRYESLKLKSIQRSEINDNKQNRDNDRDVPSSRKKGLVGDDITRDIHSSKSRLQQRRRDKPEKSGYASNLTGAALSLSSFCEPTSKTIEMNLSVQKNQPKTIDLLMDTSSDEDCPFPAPAPNPKDVIRKNKKLQVDPTEKTLHLSSPPEKVIAVPESAAKLSSKRQESQNHVSSMDHAPGRSHSSLRIKSRPRNRMLMLLDQPSHRTSPLALEQENFRSTKLDPVAPSTRAFSNSRSALLAFEQDIDKPTKLDPVSSEAESPLPHRPSMGGDPRDDSDNDTVNEDKVDELHISAFSDYSNLSDFEEASYSSIDVGINHQTIDTILSRTRPPEAQKSIPNVALALVEQQNSNYGQQSYSRSIEKPCRQPDFDHFSRVGKAGSQITKKQSRDHEFTMQTSPKHLPGVLGAIERQIDDFGGLNKDATSDWVSTSSKASGERSECNAHLLVGENDASVSNSTNKPNPPITESAITSNFAEEINVAVKAPATASCAFQQTSAITKAAVHSNLADKRNTDISLPNIDTVCPRAVVENRKFAVNTDGASLNIIESDKIFVGTTPNGSTFNATGRFMAKLMPKQDQHRVEAVPIKRTSSPMDQPATFLPTAQYSSNDIEIKQSPSSIPGNHPIEQTRSCEVSGFMSANQIAEKEAQIRTSETLTSGDQIHSRPRMINPATRGMSIQKTAKRTLHALAPTVNQMGPPAAIFGGLGSVGNTTNNTSAKSVGDSRYETGGKGPWSRESFDLFGSWRPPVQQS